MKTGTFTLEVQNKKEIGKYMYYANTAALSNTDYKVLQEEAKPGWRGQDIIVT
eukprot:Pgem_evm1s19975